MRESCHHGLFYNSYHAGHLDIRGSRSLSVPKGRGSSAHPRVLENMSEVRVYLVWWGILLSIVWGGMIIRIIRNVLLS